MSILDCHELEGLSEPLLLPEVSRTNYQAIQGPLAIGLSFQKILTSNSSNQYSLQRITAKLQLKPEYLKNGLIYW